MPQGQQGHSSRLNLGRIPAQAKLVLERARSRYPLVDITVRTFKRFSEDDGGSYAAALTYYAFFSIFPLILFAGSLLGYLTFGNEKLSADLIGEGLESVPLLGDALDPDRLEAIKNNRGNLAITGLLLALYTGSGVIVAFEHALNKLHRVPQEPNWVKKRLRSVMWLAILGGATLLSLILGGVAGFANNLVESNDTIFTVLSILTGAGVNIVIFSTAYRFLPAVQASWREVLPGAVVAAIAFEALKLGGSQFLARGEAAREASLGTLASAATLLIASFLIAQVSLLSAELNLVLKERRTMRKGTIVSATGANAAKEGS